MSVLECDTRQYHGVTDFDLMKKPGAGLACPRGFAEVDVLVATQMPRGQAGWALGYCRLAHLQKWRTL
jgi:hypothetical protein